MDLQLFKQKLTVSSEGHRLGLAGVADNEIAVWHMT